MQQQQLLAEAGLVSGANIPSFSSWLELMDTIKLSFKNSKCNHKMRKTEAERFTAFYLRYCFLVKKPKQDKQVFCFHRHCLDLARSELGQFFKYQNNFLNT